MAKKEKPLTKEEARRYTAYAETMEAAGMEPRTKTDWIGTYRARQAVLQKKKAKKVGPKRAKKAKGKPHPLADPSLPDTALQRTMKRLEKKGGK